MFTRFKVLSIILIFIIFLTIFCSILGDNGFIVNKIEKEKLKMIEKEIEIKENEVSSLRARSESSSGGKKNGEAILIHSFSDDTIFDPAKDEETQSIESFEPFSFFACFLFAFLSSVVYGLIICLLVPVIKKKIVQRNHKTS